MRGLTVVFDWIIVSSAAASILIGIIIFVKKLVKNKQSAKWHYYLWFILIARLLIPYVPQSSISLFNTVTPVAEKINYIQEESANEKIPNTAINVQSNQHNYISSINVPKHISNNSNVKINLKTYFIFIWLTGVTIFAVYTGYINLVLFFKVRKSKKTENHYFNEILKQCKILLNIDTDIPLIIESYISTPSILGVTKPILLLPKDMLKEIINDELRHIFLHELSHYKRKDNAVKSIVLLLKVLHWFNPVIWYAFYKMQEDCEIVCDYTAMHYMDKSEQEQYGYTILHMLKITSSQKYFLGTVGLLSGKSSIKRRIIMISQFNKKSVKFSVIGLGIIAAFSCILFTNAKTKADYTNNVVQGDIKTSLTNVNNNSINIKDIQEKNFNGKMMIISNPEKVSVGYSLKDSKADKTTSQIAKGENALAAINAGGFKIDAMPYGFILKDGNIIYNEAKDTKTKYPAVGFTNKGLLVVGNYSLDELKNKEVINAVVGGPALIIDGKLTEAANTNLGIGPRTAIGQKRNGTVVFLVIDGRSEKSAGAAVTDVAAILSQNEVVNASLLDGGSSSTMYYKGALINHPSYAEGERKVPSAVVLTP